MTAKAYLKEHGISEEFAELYELTEEGDYLNIPILDEDGELLFIKSRYLKHKEDSKKPKYKNSLGSHATLFNLYAVKDSSMVVITEGEIDAIKLMQEGIPSVSSTGGAGTFPDEFIEPLKDKKIYICFDNDKAGIKGVYEMLEKFPKARIVMLPQGSKDVCEFYQNHSHEDFKKLMKLALSPVEFEASFIPDDYQVMTAQELNEKEFAKIPWLIEGMIYSEGFAFVYGAEGTGKSFIALSMAIAIANGENWLDVFKVPAKTPVLYLDKENPHSLMQKRIRGLSEENIPNNLYMLKYPDKFQLSDSKGNASDFAIALSTLVKEKNIGLIVVDSMIDIMVGSENSSEDTMRFIEALRFLFPSVAKLVIHHENKPASGTFRNASQRLRGSSNINAQAFTMFRLEPVAKSKTEMTLHQTKARDEQKMDKFMIRMDVSNNKENDGTIVSGFTYLGIVASDSDGKSSEAEEIIKDVLNETQSGVSRQDLITILSGSGISESTFDRTINIMTDEGAVAKFKKGRAVWFKIKYLIVDEIKPEGGLL